MKFKFWRFDLKLAFTWRIARGVGGPGAKDYPVMLVELRDDAGRAGIGEAAPSERYDETVETVDAFLKKIDPARLSFDDIPASMAYLDSVALGNYAAKAAINIALVDGMTRAARLPIYDHFKLGFTERKHLTCFSIGIDTPEIVRKKVEAAAQYPVLKFKAGSPDDEQNFAALRSVAPHKPVRVDANEAWRTKEEALRRIEWLVKQGPIEFLEQPMPSTASRADMAWLKARSSLPLFGDESYHHASDVDLCAECFHGVNVKLVKTGGITGAYEALQAARKAGLKTMIGCMIESSVLISAGAHLAELADYLDLDGNLLITNDPYLGVTAEKGVMSFARAPEPFGLRVKARA